jgi:hypothetical protein
VRGNDRFELRMPRQGREKGIDQSAGDEKQMAEAFAGEGVQNKIGAERHRTFLMLVPARDDPTEFTAMSETPSGLRLRRKVQLFDLRLQELGNEKRACRAAVMKL